MWLYLIVGALVIVGAIGGIFAGGIFTIVLLPIAGLVLLAALSFTYLGKAEESKQQSETPEPALPHNQPPTPREAPMTPERLADARRAVQ